MSHKFRARKKVRIKQRGLKKKVIHFGGNKTTALENHAGW